MTLSPELMLRGYAVGIFPMADSADGGEVFWVDPDDRGIIPLDEFHISRNLARHIKRHDIHATLNHDFAETVRACADRDETWINAELHECYGVLHKAGYAHALDIWQDGVIAGGVFGITIGGAYFGESMYSATTNGSKMALAFLVEHLNATGFQLFDTQFITEHLASLGAVEIPRAEYHRRLDAALLLEADITATPLPTGYSTLQRITQTS